VRKPHGCQAVNIDVSSVKDVACFKSDFELVMERNDYVHALVRPVPRGSSPQRLSEDGHGVPRSSQRGERVHAPWRCGQGLRRGGRLGDRV
jgi:hypothetical protein